MAEDVKESTSQEVAASAEPEDKTAAEPLAEGQKAVADESKKEESTTEEDASAGAEGVVNFSDEEAELAASAPEFDLGEEEESEAEEGEAENGEMENISALGKAQLVELFAKLLETKPVQSLRHEVEAIKVAFYKLHRAEVESAKKQFVKEGGKAEEFVAPYDNDEIRLKEYFAQYRKKREEYMDNLARTREDNLKIKLKIIDDLKELVNSNETMNNTFNVFRELQQRWKETGAVPQANVKEIWETYNLYVENFYNYIKINKELRDLDLQRNYETKLQLCEEAETLVKEPSIVTAFRKLQDLHEQWRETGPVANEYKETVWERFKEASSRINKLHQEYFEKIKEEQKHNLELKSELCVQAEALCGEMLTSRKEWNKASEKLIEIQKVWKTIGFAPKKDNAKIYERFRNACDKFFEVKRSFYESIKSEMDNNLQLKREICEQAEAIMDSEQWKKTTDELIAMQKRWKEIGPVSRRYSDAVWKRFRAACDHFFEKKAGHFAGVDAEHDENLARKRALLEEMEACDINEGGFDKIKEFQQRWSEIGYVPIKEKDSIQKRYKEVMDAMFGVLRSGEKGRNMERFRNKISTLKSSGDKKVKFERERLYAKLKQLETNVATLENNIGFFSKSKNAEALVREVREKIEKTRNDMAELIEKINVIDGRDKNE